MTTQREPDLEIPRLLPDGELTSFPPPDRWDDWDEYDAQAWPDRVKHNVRMVPTTCFNCESACGLLAVIDKETGEIRRFEGNPAHPGSRGRNCAKGPATINQVYDPERILYPLRRKGPRGSGEWERVSWDEALNDIAGRMRKAIQEDRNDEIMYHVGRPGEDGFMDRTLKAWGVDGHNSHTNICSSGARVGYAMWMGHDRPSPIEYRFHVGHLAVALSRNGSGNAAGDRPVASGMGRNRSRVCRTLGQLGPGSLRAIPRPAEHIQ